MDRFIGKGEPEWVDFTREPKVCLRYRQMLPATSDKCYLQPGAHFGFKMGDSGVNRRFASAIDKCYLQPVTNVPLVSGQMFPNTGLYVKNS